MGGFCTPRNLTPILANSTGGFPCASSIANQWIAARDAELARYMPRPEAERALGLKNFTLATVAAAGAIRYLKGSVGNFPSRCFFFLREDVMKIKDAFEKHSVPVKAYAKPGEFIALRHAMKNYLGRRAVVEGSLVPVGYTNRFRGITGYLFRSEDLRKYREYSRASAPAASKASSRRARPSTSRPLCA